MGRKRKNIKLSYSQFEKLLEQVRSYSKALGSYDALIRIEKIYAFAEMDIFDYVQSEIVLQSSLANLKKKDLEKLLAEMNLKKEIKK